jgi:glutamate-1-semialdehyde 2,1-aminomutase
MSFNQSITLYERSCQSLSGGISSNVRSKSYPVPLFYSHGSGPYIFDVDGNRYVDYCLGQGPLLLGHSHPAVVGAVLQQVQTGQLYAGQHELEPAVSELLQRLVPCAERVRFSSSGSEAVHIALRLARAYTGRSRIIKFEGHYHGWFDDILVNTGSPDALVHDDGTIEVALESRGQSPTACSDLVVLPWNDLAALGRVMNGCGSDVAAVIMEPVMCNNGCIPPVPGFLEGVRDLCCRAGALLIFDEVITGFRLAPGGAQEYFGVVPDLATFGKAIASGFPISCLAGRRDVMQLIADGTVVHAGTYNSNPVCMAAALATLQEVTQAPGVYERLFRLGRILIDEMRAVATHKGTPVLIHGVGPVFHVAYTARDAVRNYREHLQGDPERYFSFANRLQSAGVRVIPRGIWYVSVAHADEDIDFTLKSVKDLL